MRQLDNLFKVEKSNTTTHVIKEDNRSLIEKIEEEKENRMITNKLISSINSMGRNFNKNKRRQLVEIELAKKKLNLWIDKMIKKSEIEEVVNIESRSFIEFVEQLTE